MLVISDVETNRLVNPDRLWLVGFKEVETGNVHIFEKPQDDPQPLLDYCRGITGWIGHNFIQFDAPVLRSLIPGLEIDPKAIIDTLVVSRLLNADLPGGHSLEAWGERLDCPKLPFSDFERFSPEMVTYLKGDLESTYKLYSYLLGYITSPRWKDSLRVEHDIAQVCVDMRTSGFHFDYDGGVSLHKEIAELLDALTEELQTAFPPRPRLVREITPRLTKFGTLHRGDFRWVADGNLSPFQSDCPFSLIEFIPFNPGSPKQVVTRLNEAGWKPFEKTKGHLKAEKAARPQRQKNGVWLAPGEDAEARLAEYRVTGWKCCEANLATLPASAPEAARKLVQWLVLNSRKGDLEEWFNAYNPDTHRIHGSFNGIGAWTGRMSHSQPNMANIPRVVDEPKDREASPVERLNIAFNGRMRSLWSAPPDRYLLGVDAESIQLRVLAHYMDDKNFTFAVTQGKKEDGTDPHSMNKKALGAPCKNRNVAKTFIYAWLLGAGRGKVAEILEASLDEAEEANNNFLRFYPGLADLKEYQIPADAERGYFEGFDGRLVTQDSEHLMLAGYLQNGESVIMKRACILWRERLRKERIPFEQANFVHDEWQTYVPRDLDTAVHVATIQADSIREVGEDLNLRCPMAGSILGEHGTIPVPGLKDAYYAIGDHWLQTH